MSRPAAGWAPGVALLVLGLGGVAGWPAYAAAQDSPIELDWALAYFAELREAGEAEAARLWGVPLYGPLLFVDRATHALVANLPDSAGQFAERGGIYRGVLPDNRNPANTAIDWAGRRWSMVLWPPPDDRYERRRLVFHELFHRIQPELGLPPRDPPNAHLATRDGRIWTRLEWRALREALIRNGKARAAAVEDALVFRARRHELFATAAEEERALVLNEGLAQYTGLVMSGLPEAVLADRAAVDLASREGQENLARSFAYASGPAYGLLLDQARVRWRDRLSPTADLGTLLARAYRLESLATSTAEQRAERYDGARLTAEETRLAERAAAEAARLREVFLQGPTLSLTPGAAFGYAFDPNQATPLDDLGTVFESARVTDEWGVLTVESGGVLLARSGGGISKVVVPAPGPADTAPLSGAGWRLELAKGWAVRPGSRSGDWVVLKSAE